MKTVKVTIEEAKQLIEDFIESNPNEKTTVYHMEFNLGAYGKFVLNNIEYSIY